MSDPHGWNQQRQNIINQRDQAAALQRSREHSPEMLRRQHGRSAYGAVAWSVFPVYAWGYSWGCGTQDEAIAIAESHVRNARCETVGGTIFSHWASNWWLVLAHNGRGYYTAAADSSRRKAEKIALTEYKGPSPPFTIKLSFHAASGKGLPR